MSGSEAEDQPQLILSGEAPSDYERYIDTDELLVLRNGLTALSKASD
jgi:hypothetical protein